MSLTEARSVRVAGDADALAELAAARIGEALRAQLTRTPHARLMLTGGQTPSLTYQRLAEAALPWSRIELLFGDERVVPEMDAQSNYAMIQRNLLDRLPERCAAVHRLRGDAADLDAERQRYDRLLELPVDVMLIGTGEDGHIHSLFPGAEPPPDAARVWIEAHSPKPPARRLTVTARTVREAGVRFVLASGAGKASAIAHTLRGDAPALPLALALPAHFLLDQAAASALPPGSFVRGEA